MNESSLTRPKAVRIGLFAMAVSLAPVGLWALFAPHGFYDGFPGGGHHWLPPLGPYDEHLVRDVGATFTALVALAVFAAVVLERRLVQATCVAWLIYGIPHFAYHASTADRYSTGDAIANLAGLGIQLLLPIAVLVMVGRGALNEPAKAASKTPTA